MQLTSLFAATLATATFASPIEDLQARQASIYPCTSGVFILAARGTDDNNQNPLANSSDYMNLQGMQNIAQAVVNKAGQGSYYRALDWPANPGVNYFTSIGHGIDYSQNIIKDYVNRCKATVNPRIILMGYSQGGQVMTSALIGGQLRPNLDAYKQYITGGAFFASPSFVANYPIDGGNATTSGTFRRTDADYKYFSDNYSNRIKSYCQAGDEFCANGGIGAQAQAIHQSEIATYSQEAQNYLLALV